MYEAIDDPYCYPGTTVLKNKLGIQDLNQLEAFEAEMFELRSEEPLPAGRLSLTHFQAIHHHLFQDTYSWAGRFRSVRISRGESMFAYPERIPSEMRRLFARLRKARHLRHRDRAEFVSGLTHFLAELNAIHPFRDGNGRAQLAFVAIVADQAEYPLDLDQLEPEPFLPAMIASFQGEQKSLAKVIDGLIA